MFAGLHPLYGLRVKVARANMHLSTLRDGIQTFVDTQPYEVVAKQDLESTGHVVLYGKTVRDISEAEGIRWNAMIGEIVHNLRSALDQLIWQLAVHVAGPAPAGRIPNSSPWTDLAFPVVLDPQYWNHTAAKQIFGIGPAFFQSVEDVQPFVTGQNAPERESLAVLQELWKIDKHRALPLAVAFVGIEAITPRNPLSGIADEDVGFRVVSKRDFGPFEDGAELARVEMIGPVFTSLPHMHMNPRMTFDVAFDEGYPAYGGSVVGTMEALIRDTWSVISAFWPDLA